MTIISPISNKLNLITTGGSYNLVPFNTYIVNASSLVTLNLPTSPSIGDEYYVRGGANLGGYKIQAIGFNPIQTIYFNDVSALSWTTNQSVNSATIIYVNTITVGPSTEQIFLFSSTSPGATFTGGG